MFDVKSGRGRADWMVIRDNLFALSILKPIQEDVTGD